MRYFRIAQHCILERVPMKVLRVKIKAHMLKKVISDESKATQGFCGPFVLGFVQAALGSYGALQGEGKKQC